MLLFLCTDTTVNVADEKIPILLGLWRSLSHTHTRSLSLYVSLFRGHGWNSEEHDVPYSCLVLFPINYINVTPLTYPAIDLDV